MCFCSQKFKTCISILYMKKKIVVVGAGGKMGSIVCKTLSKNFEVICFQKGSSWQNLSADLIIDFGSAESSVLSAIWASENQVPLIVGSTGQSIEQVEKIKQVASCVPVLMCSNFSIGIVIIKECIKKILQVSPSDICIFEKHHKKKKDMPSGTAISLYEFISPKTSVPVQVLAERGGEEIGTHTLDFYLSNELVEIKHMAFSREVFANGVLLATEFMLDAKDSKEYVFDDIVKEKFGLK